MQMRTCCLIHRQMQAFGKLSLLHAYTPSSNRMLRWLCRCIFAGFFCLTVIERYLQILVLLEFWRNVDQRGLEAHLWHRHQSRQFNPDRLWRPYVDMCFFTHAYCHRAYTTFRNSFNSISYCELYLLVPHRQCTAGCLSFHPMAQCVVHALKGLACRASPSRARRGHKNIICFSMGPKLRHPAVAVFVCVFLSDAIIVCPCVYGILTPIIPWPSW